MLGAVDPAALLALEGTHVFALDLALLVGLAVFKCLAGGLDSCLVQ